MRPQALRSLASQSSGHLPRKGSREDLQSGRLSRRTTDPAAEAERKAAQEKLFALDMDKVIKGTACLHRQISCERRHRLQCLLLGLSHLQIERLEMCILSGTLTDRS